MNHLFEIDESVERALHEERLQGKFDLKNDIYRGAHARAVIAETQHANQIRRFGQHTWTRDDFEFRPEMTPLHAMGFHIQGQKHGYDCWDDDEFIKDQIKRHPELKANLRPSKCMIVVAEKYSPPRS